MRTAFGPNFYRVAGIASLLSATTTLLLIFLPEFYATVAEGPAGRMERVADPVYQLRAWTYFVHPFLVFAAALGLAVACRRVSPALALGGAIGFALWAITEAAQQSLTLFAFDDWRRAWLAGDPEVRATIDFRAAIYDGLWEAAYSLLLVGFIIGNGLLGALLLRLRDILSRAVAAFLLAATVLSLMNFSAEIGGPVLPQALGYWLYPAIQPLGRFLIGLWLLNVALRGEPRVEARK